MKIFGFPREVKAEQSTTERATTERAVAEAAGHWTSFFDTAILALLDYDQSEVSARKAIGLAAVVADEALAEYERRWKR